MRFDEQVEELLKTAVTKKYDIESINIPDPDIAWSMIQETLIQERKKKVRVSYLKRVSWIVAASIVMITLTMTPQTSTAFSKLFQIINEWKDDVIRVVTKSSIHDQGMALTDPPPSEIEFESDEGAIASPKIVSLEEAEETLSFQITLPNFSDSNRYRLDKVTISPYSDGQKSDQVQLVYEGENSWFSIVEQRFTNKSVKAQEVVGASVEEVMIGDSQGILFSFENGIYSLEWIHNDIYFMIYGKLTKEEVFAISELLY